jgi:hypothetical protein
MPDTSQNEKILVIVPCAKSKIWKRNPNAGPTPAREVYASAVFTVNREFAMKYGDAWVILSAKYGFIDPSFVIPESYEVTFKNPVTQPICFAALAEQVDGQKLYEFGRIIALGGPAYRRAIEYAFREFDVHLEFPVTGLPLGRSMSFLKSYNPRQGH